MNLIINSKVISVLWWILAPLLVAKLIISFLMFFLGENSFDIQSPKAQTPIYTYSFLKFFDDLGMDEKSQVKKQEVQNLDDLVLKACYIEKDHEFIIVLKEKKSFFISLNESYNSAKLIKIDINSATFKRAGKEIELVLKETKNKSYNTKLLDLPDEASDDGYMLLKRIEFDKYLKNTKQITRDIKVQPLKNKNEFLGIKINFVRKGSLFDKMHLKKNDIITHLDNKKITNLYELLPYYKNIKNITTLHVGYERDGKIEEIIYETD